MSYETGYASNSLGASIGTTAVRPKKTGFEIAYDVFVSAHRAADRAEDVANRLCGTVPENPQKTIGKPGQDGIFNVLLDTAEDAQASLARIEMALNRIANAAGL